jgi:opacity protein-like surface antigen
MKMFQIALLSILATMTLSSQPREGNNIELGLSGSYQNRSLGSNTETVGSLIVNPRVGFYVFKGLEFEHEMVFMFFSGSTTAYNINGNISYNFISTSNTVPFLLVGYGLANTIPYFNVPLSTIDFGVNVLNLGGGLKVFLNDNVAVRIEYRFQKFSGQHENTFYSWYPFTETVDSRIHTIQFGLSVLL